MCLKWAFCMKHCLTLTPSFKVRILIPLPRGKQAPSGACFLLLRRSKDSKNPISRAGKACERRGSALHIARQVLIPLPIRAETAEFKLFLLFFCPKIATNSLK